MPLWSGRARRPRHFLLASAPTVHALAVADGKSDAYERPWQCLGKRDTA